MKMEEEQGLFEEKRVVLPISPMLRKILRIIKILAPEGQKMSKRQVVFVVTGFTLISYPLGIGMLIYIIKAIWDSPEYELLEAVQHYLNANNLFWDIVLGLRIADKLNDFLDDNQTYRFGIPRTILRGRKKIRTWNYVLLCLINLAGLGIGLIGIFGICEELIDRRNLRCEFGYPMWYPFEIRNSFVKTYIHMALCFIACYYANFLISYLMFMPENVLVICARIRHLKFLLRSIRFKRNQDFDIRKLHFCIRCHMEIISLVGRLNGIFGIFLSRRYILFMIMLSITEYDVYFNHSVDGFILLVIWFIPAILFCECGDLLSNEYAKLRWAVYGMNWYDMPPEVRKTFIIFLGSVQKPIHLTAPPMFQFNRETFLQIMKGSYSFLMYLRGFVDKN